MLMLTVDILPFKFCKDLLFRRPILRHKVDWVIFYHRFYNLESQLLCFGFDLGMAACFIVNIHIGAIALHIIPTPFQRSRTLYFCLLGNSLSLVFCSSPKIALARSFLMRRTLVSDMIFKVSSLLRF